MTPGQYGQLLADYIEDSTGIDTGYMEIKGEATLETLLLYVVRQIPSMGAYGDMQDSNSMNDQLFNIDVIAGGTEQYEAAEDLLCNTLDAMHRQVTGLMGPVRLQKVGAARQDDRLYRGMVVATLPLSAK